MTSYIKRLPERDYRAMVPKRTFQSIADTANRSDIFRNWGQTDITLSEVLQTFGELS